MSRAAQPTQEGERYLPTAYSIVVAAEFELWKEIRDMKQQGTPVIVLDAMREAHVHIVNAVKLMNEARRR
tara:strand:+ start:92 stop:301 length:210 start_codon:yes stop_codon:yes gene_type:complete